MTNNIIQAILRKKLSNIGENVPKYSRVVLSL